MSQFRNVSDDARWIVFGLDRPTEVAVDGLVTVDDSADTAYACQPAVWAPVGVATVPVPAASPVPAPETQAAVPKPAPVTAPPSASAPV
jgi:hypothetical protein